MLKNRLTSRIHRVRIRLSKLVAPTDRALVRRASMPEMTSAELPVYMDPIEWSQLVALVEVQRPQSVLEWGAGGSTRALLQRCGFIRRYVAVEHNAEWAQRVRESFHDPRLELFHIAPRVSEPRIEPGNLSTILAHGRWCEQCEEDYSVCRAYIEHPRSLGVEFDTVLVDGRARTHCLREGWNLLAPGGLLILHDAQRRETAAALAALGPAVQLEPWQQGQIAFLKKT